MALTLPDLPPFDIAAQSAALSRYDNLLKPRGSLGQLEALGGQLAGIVGHAHPKIEHPHLVLMAADHGHAAEGVSAAPSAVTALMVTAFLRGDAAVSVLARQQATPFTVVDIGVASPLPAAVTTHPAFRDRRVAPGSANIAEQPALTRAETETAIQIGLDSVQAEIAAGADVVLLGEMGIGNSTAAAAITAVLCERAVRDVTGYGSGIDPPTHQRKVALIETALAHWQPNRHDPLDVLAKVGGLEIAGLVGVALGAAAARRPVLLDGFITGAAALIAARLDPALSPYLIAAHQSAEPGHAAVLSALALVPLLRLNMRLGEGTGALLALPLLRAACATLNEMATLSDAGITLP